MGFTVDPEMTLKERIKRWRDNLDYEAEELRKTAGWRRKEAEEFIAQAEVIEIRSAELTKTLTTGIVED